MSNTNLLELGPKTLDKVARVDRLIRLEQPLHIACNIVGISRGWYLKIKNAQAKETSSSSEPLK